MIGLLIVAHESVGHAYLQLATHFFGDMPKNIRVLNVNCEDKLEVLVERISALLLELNTGNGVLILTDIFGATPSNAVRQLLENCQTVMLTGLNAPMMVKAMQYADKREDLSCFAEEVKQAALDGIMMLNGTDEWSNDAETRN